MRENRNLKCPTRGGTKRDQQNFPGYGSIQRTGRKQENGTKRPRSREVEARTLEEGPDPDGPAKRSTTESGEQRKQKRNNAPKRHREREREQHGTGQGGPCLNFKMHGNVRGGAHTRLLDSVLRPRGTVTSVEAFLLYISPCERASDSSRSNPNEPHSQNARRHLAMSDADSDAGAFSSSSEASSRDAAMPDFSYEPTEASDDDGHGGFARMLFLGSDGERSPSPRLFGLLDDGGDDDAGLEGLADFDLLRLGSLYDGEPGDHSDAEDEFERRRRQRRRQRPPCGAHSPACQ